MLRYLFPSLFSIILLNTVVTVNAKPSLLRMN